MKHYQGGSCRPDFVVAINRAIHKAREYHQADTVLWAWLDIPFYQHETASNQGLKAQRVLTLGSRAGFLGLSNAGNICPAGEPAWMDTAFTLTFVCWWLSQQAEIGAVQVYGVDWLADQPDYDGKQPEEANRSAKRFAREIEQVSPFLDSRFHFNK